MSFLFSFLCKLPQIQFHETIRAFSLTNEELAQKRGGKKDFENCRKSCKFLLEQMEKKRFPWRPVALTVFFLLVTAFVIDLILHEGFKYSVTHQFMQKTGISHVLKQAWTKITLYSGIAFSWLAINIPLYYAKVCELCGPYLRLLVQKLEWIGLKVLELLQPAIVYLQQQLPILLQWIQTKAPIVLAAVQDNLTVAWNYISSLTDSVLVVILPYLVEAWETLSFYSIIFWESVEPAISSAWLWLKTSVGTT
ncbi:putative transmembrane protein [Apostichopus japonicus]|uniref:Putative transmembrane protein n=1 Tax=Stichopus japonicus TaxID=307972 RepID=A0A2G8JIG8_STIJA|nr:putative transmembrane protein [Apostichopus japonicus]